MCVCVCVCACVCVRHLGSRSKAVPKYAAFPEAPKPGQCVLNEGRGGDSH